MTQTETNKNIAITAYQIIFGDLDIPGVDELMGKDFLQHNPTVPDRPESVKAVVQMLVSNGVPKQKVGFKHIVAEDNMVIRHSRREMAGKE
ncbi:nuclear transport factor 2 family protein [Pedobacter sp. GR22-6]|uniref:nuclear transport factor 2 family protein n=1 Tax=Pedobacter sp. GR22-6 TaxID=3127957 RepID=UPI00307D60E4